MDYRQIIMKSKNIKIVKILRKTKASMFKDLKENDIITFELSLKRAGRSWDTGTYASYIKITNITTCEYVYKSSNQLSNILNAFELEEVGD